MFDWLLGKGGRAYSAPDETQLNERRKGFDAAYSQGDQLGQALAAQTAYAQGGDSAGQALLRHGMNQAAAEQASQAASARGGAMQLAAARQAAMQNTAALQGQAANQAAALKSQEVQQALAAQAGYQGQREQAQLGALGAETSLYGAKNQMAMEQGKAENDRSKGLGSAIGGAAMAGAGLMMMSDERAKDNIQQAEPSALERLMASQHPTTYRYKGDDQERLGVIAQDLEGSELGKLLIQQDSSGMLAINKDAALSALLAEVGYLHDEIAALKGGK